MLKNYNMMKIRFSWALVALIFAGLFVSCSSDDETELLGNWVEEAQFSGAPRSNTESVVINEVAYIIGGDDGDLFGETWSFTPSTRQWKQMDDFPDDARRGAVAFAIDGKAYYGTGYDGDDKRKDFWCFDPSKPDSSQWERVADFPGDERYGAVAFSLNNMGFVGAGYSDQGSTNDFYKYDPTTNTWTAASTPDRKFYDGVAFIINDIAYVGTGINNGSYEEVFNSYDATTDIWTSLNELTYDDSYEVARSNAVAFTLNGKGYIGTGNYSGIRSDFWEYDPTDDSWTEVTSFEGSARQDAAAFVIGDKAYVATGKNGSYYYDDVWYFEPDVDYDEED
jgi:N-acetylneuraminic acid mutarotase